MLGLVKKGQVVIKVTGSQSCGVGWGFVCFQVIITCIQCQIFFGMVLGERVVNCLVSISLRLCAGVGEETAGSQECCIYV